MQRVVFVQLAAGLLIGGAFGAAMGYFGKCTSGTCPLTANPWRGAFIGAMMGGVIAFSGGASRSTGTTSKGQAAALHITSPADFDRIVVNAEKPVLVDFYSNDCPPCRKLSPTVDELAREYQGRAVVCKINIDDVPEMARQYEVQAIPAVLFFDKGAVVERLIRLQPRNAYTAVLDRLIG